MTDDNAKLVEDFGSAAERLAVEIRRLRTTAGLSQARLAALVGYTPAYISLAERPGKGLPSAAVVQAIDCALDANGSLMLLRQQAETDQKALRTHVAPGHDEAQATDDVLRREFLTSSLLTGLQSIIPTPSSGKRIGSDVIAQLRQRGARLRRLDDFFGGADTYRLYKAELDSTVQLVKSGSYTPRTAQQLQSILAEQSQQAGWAAFDAGWNDEAQRLFTFALSAAKDARDASLEGNSWAYLAYQETSLGRSGVLAAAKSFGVAGPDAPAKVQALLLERLAWAHAKVNQPREAERALAQAAEILEQERDSPAPHWASWVDDREIKIMTGRCWTELHRPVRAILTLEDALSDFDDDHARDKALYLSWLAEAYLDGGEVEQSASVVEQALDLCVGVGSVRPIHRLQSFTSRLQKYRSIDPVGDVLDRLSIGS